MTQGRITRDRNNGKYDWLSALYRRLVEDGVPESEAAQQVDAAMIADMRRRGVRVTEADL